MTHNNYAIIMAGGIGSRFWPMSRTSYPKQFLDILQTGSTLLQSTFRRFQSFIPNEKIYVVTSEEYMEIVRKQLPEIPESNIIGEPERKNTASCIALISFKLRKMDPAANMIIAPSDHVIDDNTAFIADCRLALDFTAKNNAFLTLGIQPNYPNTGYGYIQCHPVQADAHIHKVACFREKPDRDTAKRYLADGNYLWNAGIFIWKAKDILDVFEKLMPEMFTMFSSELAQFNTSNEGSAVRRIYSQCESISIDYAILEKAENVHVIRASFGWNDLGTWSSAWEMFSKDELQNAVAGKNTIMIDANGCLVHSTEKKLVLVGGVEDLIVVNTPDALLICKKENEQQIKQYLDSVKNLTGNKYL